MAGLAVSEVDLLVTPPTHQLTRFSQALTLANATEAYRRVASTHLGTLHSATEALREQGTREDKATGTTPRKRMWDYVDKWKLTESRDDVLRAWRERASNTDGETSLAEHLPPPEAEEEEEMDEAMDMKLTEAELPVELENLPAAGSPGASSFDSTPSILEVAPPLQLKKPSVPKLGITTLGTLTDSRNVYTTRGLRRGR